MAISMLLGLLLTAQPSSLSAAQVVVTPTLSIASKPEDFSLKALETIPFALEEMLNNSCSSVPNGLGIPGFQPGIHKDDVLRMLGLPTISSVGYWPNTKALSYDLVPNEVSLGFLLDKNSERIRQTEAAFTSGVTPQIILVTLNGMLGCKLNDKIKLGLQQVQLGRYRRYSFNLGSLKGVIERQKSDRIYIGIWEADLH